MENNTFIVLRDNATLQPLADTADGDGKVYDLYNAVIRQSINAAYNASFNILPYTDVWRIGYPNIVELDNDYFMIVQVIKRRSDTLGMTIELDHISYELNRLEKNEDGEYQQEFDEEISYSGMLSEIVDEILEDTRFERYIQNDVAVDEFLTKKVGKRSRLIELAQHVEQEIEWEKLAVRFRPRLGFDHGLTCEVGKNIRSLTVKTTINVGGELIPSLEIDAIDTAYIEEPDLETLFTVKLGDTIRIVDEQFGIDKTERVISIEYDPFKKALPKISVENVIADTSNTTNVNAGVGGGGNGATLETAKGAFFNGLEFRFTKPYDNLYSVTVSTTKPETEANVYYSEVKNAEGKFTGIKVHSVEPLSGVQVSMQAVVK